jgi:hypothetical protein
MLNLRFHTVSVALGLSLSLFSSAALVGCTKKPVEKKISGVIELSPELQKTLKPSAVLYIIARKEGETSGPPTAVKKFTQPFAFPLEFQITPQDAMMPNTPFEGNMKITARISQSGSATPVQAGDIEAQASNASTPMGNSSVKLILNQVK